MAEKPSMPFLTDVTTLRQRAREHIMEGAVTQGYTANRETVVKLLNEAGDEVRIQGTDHAVNITFQVG